MEFDPASDRGPVPSPCISICVMDEAIGLCSGCQRNIDEIIGWASAGDAWKREVWQRINMIRQAHANQPG